VRGKKRVKVRGQKEGKSEGVTKPRQDRKKLKRQIMTQMV